jgi:hypothetical protein
MSFRSNIGKHSVTAGPDQCEMVDAHHPDCECTSCRTHLDVQCLEPYVGEVPECDGVRVCGACAVQMEREEFTVKYRPGTRFVVVHPEMGIYLGSAMGLGFWSKMDPVGQVEAITFPDRETAERVMRSWDSGRPDAAVTWPVVPDHRIDCDASFPSYASVEACVAAGLPAWDLVHRAAG